MSGHSSRGETGRTQRSIHEFCSLLGGQAPGESRAWDKAGIDRWIETEFVLASSRLSYGNKTVVYATNPKNRSRERLYSSTGNVYDMA